jgi:hypothetical protein
MLREDFNLNEAIRYMVSRLGSAGHFNTNSLALQSDGKNLPYKNKPLSKEQAKKRAASKKARKARKK